MAAPRNSLLLLLAALALLGAPPRARAQVSPQEVANPELKALTSEYFQNLVALNREIGMEKFPFPFRLSRYVGLDPKNQAASDTRGLEFVRFQDRLILKCSGNYNAAFDAKQFTRNQRADQVFSAVVSPILLMLPQYFADAKDFDGVGFEISYHVREASSHADFEGKENLVVVLAVSDALRFSQARISDEQQDILNGSEVYLSGERFGLALGKADPLPVEELGASTQPSERAQNSAGRSRTLSKSGRGNEQDLHASSGARIGAPASTAPPPAPPPPPPTPAEVDQLQAKFQSDLENFGKHIGAVMHQASSSPPDLAVFRNALYLQLTVANPEIFDKDKTSLYKRAALSFDTFLAPHLGDLVSGLPAIPNLAGLDITVLVKVSATGSASEAVEFACPLPALRSFSTFEITNQELIDQSIVIVNGVRISLHLQQVE